MRSPSASTCLLVALACLLTGFEWEGQVRRLAEQLQAGDVAQRRDVVRQLGAHSSPAVAEAIGLALEDTDAGVRAEAATVVGRSHIRTAVPRLLEKLGDPAAEVRARAAEALGAMQEERALAPLVRGLGDSDAGVRRSVVRALAAVGGADAAVPLIGRLDDDDASVRTEAAMALGTLGDAQAVVPLIGRSRDPIPEVRTAALEALGELEDSRAVGGIRQGLRDSDETVQLAAIRAAGTLGSSRLVDDLEALLAESDSRSQRAVLTALGALGGDRAMGSVVAALRRSDTREVAINVLSVPGEDDVDRVIAALIAEYRRSGGPGHDTAIAQTLERLGANHSTRMAAAPLVEALRTSRGGSGALVRALAATGAPEALVPILVRLPDADDRTTAQLLSALELLFERAPPDGRATDPLLAVLGEVSPRNRLRIVRLLGQLRNSQATESLLPLLEHDDRTLRIEAARAIGTVGGDAVAAPLLRLLDESDAELRFEAAVGLGRVAETSHVRSLLGRLENRGPIDRHAVLLALGGALQRLHGDGSVPPEVARAAGDALRRAMASRDDELVARAMDTAGRWAAAPAVDALLRQLGRGPPHRRRTAARQLANAAGTDSSVRVARALAAVASSHAPVSVRAAATASLGEFDGEHTDNLLLFVRDGVFPVDAAAAFALARLARRGVLPPEVDAESLCPLARHRGAFVRANIAVALASGGARCADGPEPTDWLDPSHSAAVRAAGAVWLGAIVTSGDDAHREALSRCGNRELSAFVRQICHQPALLPLAQEADVYAYARDGETLLARRLVVLRFADGTALVTSSDANGHVRWPNAPDGPVALSDPFDVPLEPR